MVMVFQIVGVAIILSLLFKKPPEEDSAVVDEDSVEANDRFGAKKPGDCDHQIDPRSKIK